MKTKNVTDHNKSKIDTTAKRYLGSQSLELPANSFSLKDAINPGYNAKFENSYNNPLMSNSS